MLFVDLTQISKKIGVEKHKKMSWEQGCIHVARIEKRTCLTRSGTNHARKYLFCIRNRKKEKNLIK